MAAKDYFVKLSPTGQSNRQALLQNKYSNLTSSMTSEPEFKEQPFKEISSLHSKNVLQSWLIFQGDDSDFDIVLQLQQQGIIEYYEKIGRFKIDFDSNDSLAGEQWYLNKIDLQKAWNISKGNPDIIIGVIDTGIDYMHPDLQNSLWVNASEDLNGNGQLDQGDLNNFDDDGNGFIDDVVGWDFTDAPRFADGGDFKDPDNQPWDEFGAGHGTQIAGIIAAVDNNGIGISGIAPGVKVMNLRAGTASGYLEEDDVAKAILYAIDNGAQIINMSFGDTALSRFLKDIIQYANDQGVVLIASAGNSASNEIHYPSGLPEVICVGSSTINDRVSGFSNFGNTIDLVAPGSEITSTAINGSYNSVNGTSFSAPVVSAVAALILSINQNLSSEQVRNILKSSSDDIIFNGWDESSGAGRISAFKALSIPFAGEMSIATPRQNQSYSDHEIVISGTIAHPDLQKATIEYGLGKAPQNWNTLAILEGRQVVDDTLAAINVESFPDTAITLRLNMRLINSMQDELHTTFFIDRTVPKINDISIISMWDAYKQGSLISFSTDDICTAQLKIREANTTGDFVTVSSSYETRNHRIKIDRDIFAGEFEFYIEAENSAGLTTINDNASLYYKFAHEKSVAWNEFINSGFNLPAGYMLPYASDLDHDGNKEIIISRYDDNSAFGPIEIYEFNQGRFDLRLKTAFNAIPRAAGDVDNDGKSDMLLGFGQFSFLFEAAAADSFPKNLVWQDTVNFWAAAYSDIDNDNRQEIIGRINESYVVRENSNDNKFSQIAELSNTTAGQNRLGVPHVLIKDLDFDGKDDIVFGDYDGDIVAYTAKSDNLFTALFTGRTIHPNATEFIAADKNGNIITATHTADDLNYEHEFDARYWTIQTFDSKSSILISQDTINTFGFSPTKDFDSGLRFSLFDDREILFASFFPNLFVFERVDQQWQPIWFSDKARSNTVLVEDFDNDGNDEFYFNDGVQIIGYSTAIGERPARPLFLKAAPKDSTKIEISWQATGAVSGYNIYRGKQKTNLEKKSFSNTSSFIDSTVNLDELFYYAVSAIDSNLTNPESFLSNVDSAQTAIPPDFTNLQFVNSRQVILNFDRQLSLSTIEPASAVLTLRNNISSSLILTNTKKSVLVSFPKTFSESMLDTLKLLNVFGLTGVPLNTSVKNIPIYYQSVPESPYINNFKWIDRKTLSIIFSQPMQTSALRNEQNYKIEPSGKAHIELADSSGQQILITFSKDTFLGSSGQASYLLLNNLYGVNNKKLAGNNVLSLFRESDNLDNVKVYPQPLRPNHDQLTFSNLPREAIVKIYSFNGKPVRSLEASTSYGGVKWNLKDDKDEKVASGIYIYNIILGAKSKQGKLVIVR